MLGNSQCASREDPTVSACTNSEFQRQLEARLGVTKLMQIRWVVGHPSRLASRPPVGSPSCSLPPQFPIARNAQLDIMFGGGNLH
eukprot:1155966-Pelagomonas_calceolata.AAC.1